MHHPWRYLIAKSALTVAGAAPEFLRVAQTTGFPLDFQNLAVVKDRSGAILQFGTDPVKRGLQSASVKQRDIAQVWAPRQN